MDLIKQKVARIRWAHIKYKRTKIENVQQLEKFMDDLELDDIMDGEMYSDADLLLAVGWLRGAAEHTNQTIADLVGKSTAFA